MQELASFINLDLELSADQPLDALEHHFARASFTLFNGEVDGGHRLAMEPVIDGRLNRDAIACTEHFLELIRTLPEGLMGFWKACSSRVFDYGFDGGLESPPARVVLPSALLREMARYGIDAQITVYPFRKHAGNE